MSEKYYEVRMINDIKMRLAINSDELFLHTEERFC